MLEKRAEEAPGQLSFVKLQRKRPRELEIYPEIFGLIETRRPASFLRPFLHFASADVDVYSVKVAESGIRELLLGWPAF